MNPIQNIWQHPKTSIVGLLLGIVSVAGALNQQGVSLGNAGTGTVVALISGIATALLGLLARDPATSTATSSVNSTSKLGAWALIALLMPLPFIEGCNATTVAQDIVNWTPTLQSAVAAVDATGSILDPAAAPIFTAATIGFDAASDLLVNQAKAYLANPSAPLLQQMQQQVVAFQQIVSKSLLAAAHITNPASQQHALSVIQVVATAVNAILALIAQLSGKVLLASSVSAVSVTAAPITLAAIERYRNRSLEASLIANHYGESLAQARAQIAATEQIEQAAGL